MFGYSNRIQLPAVTKNLLIINICVFIMTKLGDNFMYSNFALFYPGSRFFHFWQYLTYMFMHGNFWHLFFNMFALYMFGTVIEQIIGSRKFLTFYLICGLGAAALHTGVQFIEAQTLLGSIADGSQKALNSYQLLKMTPTVGASGAIYGVLIAYAMLFPDNRLTLIFPPISLKAKWWVIIFAGIELITGIFGTAEHVAHFAHLGGMLVGWLLIRYWRNKNTLFDRDKWI